MSNLSSLSYYIPELIIICTIIFTIIADLIPSINRYSFGVSLFGMISTGIMM